MKNILGFLALSFLFQSIHAQHLSGIVTTSSGDPIENALVSIADDPSIWVKTNSDGSFSLSGEANDQLKVAALYYETISDYSISASSGIEITLQKDPLLETDVYHIGFDHLRPGDYYSVDELKEDFTIAYGKGFYDGSTELSNRSYVDKKVSVDDNGTSLRVKYPKGKLKTGESGIDTRIYLSGNYKTGAEFTADELYLSYWVKYDDNFDFKCGGKIPSLGGEFTNSNNGENERWKGRIMWRNGGSIQFYPELPHKFDSFEHDSLRFWGEKEYDGGDICSNEFTPYLTNGEWHNIELHYKVNDDESNGLFEGWIDGNKGHKIINSEVFGLYRRAGEGLDNLTINFIMISTFFGGSSVEYEPDQDVYAWYDEFRVSTQRINEYEKYAGSIITHIEEPEQSLYSAFPNPSSTGLFELSSPTTWTVLNTTGVVVTSGKGKTIDLTNNARGVYFLKTGNDIQKLIKK